MSRVGNYVDGRFWTEFDDNAGLGVSVNRALQEHRTPDAPVHANGSDITRRRHLAPRHRLGTNPSRRVRNPGDPGDPIEPTLLRPVAS